MDAIATFIDLLPFILLFGALIPVFIAARAAKAAAQSAKAGKDADDDAWAAVFWTGMTVIQCTGALALLVTNIR